MKKSKKLLLILIPIIILMIFLSYQSKQLTSNLKKDNTPSMPPTISTGSSIYEPEINTKKPNNTMTPANKTSNQNDVLHLDISKENDDPDEAKKNKLIPITRIFNVKINAFYYLGMTCTPYEKGNKLDIRTWEVDNLCKYPVKSNLHIKFYDNKKEKIGEYQKAKMVEKTTYDEEKDWQNEEKIDAGQGCSMQITLDKNVLKSGYDFSDVIYVAISDIPEKPKATKKPKNTITPEETEVPKISASPNSIKKSAP